MPRRISTGPALPDNVRRASSNVRIVSRSLGGIGRSFINAGTLAYGAIALGCKAALFPVALIVGQITPVQAQDVVIPILGDSLVAGYGLPSGEGLVPKLQEWLEAQDAEVVLQNAGVSGDTTSGGGSRLDWTLGDGAQALVVSLGANDMLRGIDPALARKNLDAILGNAAEQGLPLLLIGFNSPANWGADYKRDFDKIYPDLSAKYETLFLPSFFAALAPDGDVVSAQKYLQADGLHPNPEGISLLVETIGPLIANLAEFTR